MILEAKLGKKDERILGMFGNGKQNTNDGSEDLRFVTIFEKYIQDIQFSDQYSLKAIDIEGTRIASLFSVKKGETLVGCLYLVVRPHSAFNRRTWKALIDWTKTDENKEIQNKVFLVAPWLEDDKKTPNAIDIYSLNEVSDKWWKEYKWIVNDDIGNGNGDNFGKREERNYSCEDQDPKPDWEVFTVESVISYIEQKERNNEPNDTNKKTTS